MLCGVAKKKKKSDYYLCASACMHLLEYISGCFVSSEKTK